MQGGHYWTMNGLGRSAPCLATAAAKGLVWKDVLPRKTILKKFPTMQ
jgi:hypothetical protein